MQTDSLHVLDLYLPKLGWHQVYFEPSICHRLLVLDEHVFVRQHSSVEDHFGAQCPLFGPRGVVNLYKERVMRPLEEALGLTLIRLVIEYLATDGEFAGAHDQH